MAASSPEAPELLMESHGELLCLVHDAWIGKVKSHAASHRHGKVICTVKQYTGESWGVLNGGGVPALWPRSCFRTKVGQKQTLSWDAM